MVPPPLVLASASPRRQRLLAEAGLEFEVLSLGVPEWSTRSLTIRELTIANAARKALTIGRRRKNAVVLGADTLVGLDGAVIGKPANLRAAARTLARLSGREHHVCTAVFLCSIALRQVASFQVVSQVRFRILTSAEISAYIAKINPLDKAGAYAAQGHGSEIIERIRGSYTNVVGLPMGETLRALRLFGISPQLR